MKFGGSSVRDATRIRAVASIVKDNRARYPIVVLSAMGKTTTNLITAARRAIESEVLDLSEVETLHYETAEQLNVGEDVIQEIATLLKQCRSILEGLRLVRDLSPAIEDVIMSFGERMAVRLFAGYLRSLDVPSKAWDAYDMGEKIDDHPS